MLDYIENKYQFDLLQQTLLMSLAYKNPENIKFFLKWIATVDFDSLSYGSLRLIPLLFSTFQNFKEGNPYHGRMKGIYRYFLCKNSGLLATGRVIIHKLIEAKIDFILFKGAALTIKYYKNNAVRPMGDIDFLIHPNDVLRAEKIFLDLNLKYRYEAERRIAANEHSFDYIDIRNNGYDLHWYSLFESRIKDIDKGIWQRARSFDWEGLNVKIMAPEDLILMSCINGIRDLSLAQYYWLIDVVKIVEAEPAIRWKIISHEANSRNLSREINFALSWVRTILECFIPESFVDDFLETNKNYRSELLNSFFAEGRIFGVKWKKMKKIKKFLVNSVKGVLPPLKKFTPVIPTSGSIRYFFNEDREINLLYLRYEHLSAIEEVFDVIRPEVLKRIIQQSPTVGEGYLQLASNVLALKTHYVGYPYNADIKILNIGNDLLLMPGEIKKIKLIVRNNFSYMWLNSFNPNVKLGVSYHLLSSDRKMLTFEQPRTYFLEPKKNHVVFIGVQEIEVELDLHVPLEAGDYIVQFDMVHEGVYWYSDHGNLFPVLNIKVSSANNLDFIENKNRFAQHSN
jgi:hypothetical protein